MANADGTTTGAAAVTIGGGSAPITVTASPASAAVQVNGTVQFTATVLNGSGGVTWSVIGGAGNGTVSAGGLYTAPASVPSPATVTVNVPMQTAYKGAEARQPRAYLQTDAPVIIHEAAESAWIVEA